MASGGCGHSSCRGSLPQQRPDIPSSMRPALLAVVATLVLLSEGAAQMSSGASTTLATRYIWRGITRVSGWVVQPAAWIVIRSASTQLSVSGWGNWESGTAGSGDLTQRGIGQRGFGEADLDLGVSQEVGAIGVAAGWTRYTFHGDSAQAGRSSSENTSELFARIEWHGSTVTPSILAACDVDRVRGCYFEVGAPLPIFATSEPRPTLIFSIEPTAGWSQGEGPNSDDPTQLSNFAGNGLTHVDLPLLAQAQFSGGTLEPAFSLAAHLQWCADGATRTTNATGSTTRVKFWLEVGATLAAGLPREQRR